MDRKNSKILHSNIFSKIEHQSMFYEIILIAYSNRFLHVHRLTRDLRTVHVVILQHSTDVLKCDNPQKKSSISRILMTPFPLKRAESKI